MNYSWGYSKSSAKQVMASAKPCMSVGTVVEQSIQTRMSVLSVVRLKLLATRFSDGNILRILQPMLLCLYEAEQ